MVRYNPKPQVTHITLDEWLIDPQEAIAKRLRIMGIAEPQIAVLLRHKKEFPSAKAQTSSTETPIKDNSPD